jgi:lysine 6-dehydrogenase
MNGLKRKDMIMSIRYAIFGAGRQGTASAFELAVHGDASVITLLDRIEDVAMSAADRVNRLTESRIAKGRRIDVQNRNALEKVLEDADACISAVPYYHNLELTKAAIRTKTHMTDMGGNEQVVRDQLGLSEEAKKARISIIPDCGMGPGMTGSLAAYGISLMDEAHDVYIWDGGLPQNPHPPWNFQLTFHINGLTNEYDSEATFIREGRVIKLPTFSEYELVDFPPFGTLEAFVTSGGTSSAIMTYEGKLQTYQNKTLRYPGHFEQFRAYKLLGLFDLEPISFEGKEIIPRDFFHFLLEPKIKASEDYRDMCLIRVTVRGLKEGKPHEFIGELIDKYDGKTGFSSMQRLTGWHTAIMLEMAVQGRARKGVHGLEMAVEPSKFISEVKKRGIKIKESLLPILPDKK